jgi:phosphoribosyl-ATP pyrophosphohydrolase
MSDILKELEEIAKRRKAENEEGSYTVYLYKEGLDKVLKKLGEEASETIIASKNLEACNNAELDSCTEKEELVGEVGDLLYHLVIMLDMLGVDVCEVEDLLRSRMNKTKNLKDYTQFESE